MSISVELYEVTKKEVWDNFIDNAKNSHFMFKRDYVEYHADRFEDFSLMFFDEKKRLFAVLPANRKDNTLYSHQGLTFGGLVVTRKVTTDQVYMAFLAIVEFLKTNAKIESFIYKRMPDFYSSYPAQEDLYAMFLLNAKLLRRDVSSLIDLSTTFPYTKGRKWSVNKAKKMPIEINDCDQFSAFWQLLDHVLKVKHGAKPAHSLKEIESLNSKFSNNMKCYTAIMDGEVLAGAVVYESGTVAHTQYLANSEKGRDLGALDFVIDHLLKSVYKDWKYFDFGISTEEGGRSLNKGLIAQKEGFGARAFVHDFYEIKVK